MYVMKKLYHETSWIAKNYKNKYPKISEALRVAARIPNHFCIDRTFQVQAGVIIYELQRSLEPGEWESVATDGMRDLLKNGGDTLKDHCRYHVLKFRLDNIIGYLIGGREDLDWSEVAKEFMELHKKYYNYD